MPRNLSSGLITSLSGRQIRVADLIELHLSTPIYFNTSFVDLTYDSVSAPDDGANTYLAQGQFIGLGNVQETKDLKIGTMNIAFTAVDYTTLGYVLNNEYIDRRVVVYRAVLDDNYAIDSTKVFQYFDGRIKDFNISESKETATLAFNVGSQFADFSKISGRRTNSDSQQRFFSGDLGFEFSPQIQTDIKWGRT